MQVTDIIDSVTEITLLTDRLDTHLTYVDNNVGVASYSNEQKIAYAQHLYYQAYGDDDSAYDNVLESEKINIAIEGIDEFLDKLWDNIRRIFTKIMRAVIKFAVKLYSKVKRMFISLKSMKSVLEDIKGSRYRETYSEDEYTAIKKYVYPSYNVWYRYDDTKQASDGIPITNAYKVSIAMIKALKKNNIISPDVSVDDTGDYILGEARKLSLNYRKELYISTMKKILVENREKFDEMYGVGEYSDEIPVYSHWEELDPEERKMIEDKVKALNNIKEHYIFTIGRKSVSVMFGKISSDNVEGILMKIVDHSNKDYTSAKFVIEGVYSKEDVINYIDDVLVMEKELDDNLDMMNELEKNASDNIDIAEAFTRKLLVKIGTYKTTDITNSYLRSASIVVEEVNYRLRQLSGSYTDLTHKVTLSLVTGLNDMMSAANILTKATIRLYEKES